MQRGFLMMLCMVAAVGCDDDGPVDAGPPDVALDGAVDQRLPDAAADAADVDQSAGDMQPGDMRPSDMRAPDMAAGDMSGPDMSESDMATPDMAAPDMSAPDMAAPDMAAPDMGPPAACDHPRSDCRVDADCGGGTCQPLPDDPAAPCVCVGPRPQPSRAFCEGGGFESECCEDVDCAPPPNGVVVCQQSAYGPQNDYCGGAPPPEENSCRRDDCLLDDDCVAGQVCVPAGVFGFVVNTCRPAPCRVDADCEARAGGECRPYFDRCVSGSFGCSYPDSPCRTNEDCPVGRFGDREFCVPGPAGDTVCQEFLPAP